MYYVKEVTNPQYLKDYKPGVKLWGVWFEQDIISTDEDKGLLEDFVRSAGKKMPAGSQAKS